MDDVSTEWTWSPCPALRGLPILQCPLLENAHPPTRSCLFHGCFLAAPPLALSPLSVQCEPRGTAILLRRQDWSIPLLHLLWLRLVALSNRLRWAPSSRQLHMGPESLRLCRGSPDLCLSRQSPQLHPGPLDPRHPPGSLALRLRLLHRHWSVPWSRHPSSMSPPSVSSTVGYHHGCGLGPAVLLLLQVPPV